MDLSRISELIGIFSRNGMSSRDTNDWKVLSLFYRLTWFQSRRGKLFQLVAAGSVRRIEDISNISREQRPDTVHNRGVTQFLVLPKIYFTRKDNEKLIVVRVTFRGIVFATYAIITSVFECHADGGATS
ncbi:hypothetical protein OUZ56_021235 [Daphnia magna]|uniref:Uncharacterized protein n=1 Tax=Daphnia magna TaxID=35525 RepID=A0ABQ9ZGT8_9CRUS|nr:hypothetical protein OUZ56_021235 [Daphnia magna]